MTSSRTVASGKGLRTHPLLQVEYAREPSLTPPCIVEALIIMPHLCGAISMAQSIIGSCVCRVIGLGSVRASVSRRAQCKASNCYFNGV